MKTLKEIREARGKKIDRMKGLNDLATAEERDLTEDEQAEYDALKVEVENLAAWIARMEETNTLVEENERSLGTMTQRGQRGAAAVLQYGRGDSEARALAAFARRGDVGGFPEEMRANQNEISFRVPMPHELRAATDSTMNITTAGDGGNLVPTGFVNRIARRKQEMLLAQRLGVMRVPGSGTTVNYPLQSADAQVFATTSEQADNHSVAWERDAPQVGQKAFTLALKTKKIELTDQLLYDEDAGLMDFIAGVIADGVALTHNAALLTEVAANGASLKTFASASTIADGELEDIVYHNTLAYYLDDSGNVAWVMRPPTFGTIAKVSGNARTYAGPNTEGGQSRVVLEYPTFFSSNAAGIAASAKSVYFGNWGQVGYREDPTLTLLRDPYSVDGLTILKYSFRLVYGVLQAGGIGYGVHPTA